MRRTLPLAAAIAIAMPASAGALDLPARKPGLWEIKMSFEGRNILPQASQHCIDAETDKLMNAIGAARRGENCSKQDIKRVGGEIIVDSVCKFGDATTTSHAVVSGDFSSAYSVKVSSKREGGRPLPGVPAGGETTMTIDAKWLGACKADQKPGDMIMPGGRKINIRDLQNIPGMPQ
jgi:hypothetical protein